MSPEGRIFRSDDQDAPQVRNLTDATQQRHKQQASKQQAGDPPGSRTAAVPASLSHPSRSASQPAGQSASQPRRGHACTACWLRRE